MDSISAYSPASTVRPGTYERNVKEYGPVVASALGAAQSLGEAASATVDFSEEALSKISHGVSAAVDEVEEMASDLGQALSKVGDEVSDFAGDVVDGVGSAVHSVGQYVGLGTAATVNALSSIA